MKNKAMEELLKCDLDVLMERTDSILKLLSTEGALVTENGEENERFREIMLLMRLDEIRFNLVDIASIIHIEDEDIQELAEMQEETVESMYLGLVKNRVIRIMEGLM